MWLLAGCHLLSSGAISKTCPDAGCDDSEAPPDHGDPSRQLVGLACETCGDDGGTPVPWLVPDPGDVFPPLPDRDGWDGPVAYDNAPDQGIVYVANGGSIVRLVPGALEPSIGNALVVDPIVDMVADSGLVFFTTGPKVYRWAPNAENGLQRVSGADDEVHAFDHLFLDKRGGGLTVWAVDVTQGIDLWRLDDVASMTLAIPGVWSDASIVAGGMFVGRDDLVSGCSAEGSIYLLVVGKLDTLVGSADARALGCGYDPGLEGHVVIDATRGALFAADGTDEWVPYAAPDQGVLLAGALVP